MTLKHFAIKTIFTTDWYNLEWNSLPSDIQNILQNISNDVFNNDEVWPRIPKYIIEMADFDNITDETDNYQIIIDGGDFYWYSNRMSYYLDINQWMLLDPEKRDEYDYKLSNKDYTCELIVHITDIYENPTVKEISLDIDLDGDIASYEISPKNTLKYPITKEEIINNFGEDVYEED